jgi:hypothetical protein
MYHFWASPKSREKHMTHQHKKALTIFVLCSVIATAAFAALASAQTTGTLAAATATDSNIITLTGSGFDPSETVALKLQNQTDDSTVYNFTEAITTDDTGAFAVNITLPIGIYGTYDLTAETSTVTASTEITLSGAAALTASPDNSNIITAAGMGFNANETVTLQLNDTSTGSVYNFTENITTDNQGNFSATVIIPTSISGSYSLIASTSTASANTTITVPDFTGPTGATGSTGPAGSAGTDGTAGTPADNTFGYIAVALSLAAIVAVAYTLIKKL